MWWLLSIIACILISLGCATTHPDLLPPSAETLPPAVDITSFRDRQSLDYFLLKMLSSSKDKRTEWWIEYRRASLWSDVDPNLSCSKFALLSREERFPLRQLATIRARENCAAAGLKEELPIFSVTKPWLNRPNLDAEIAQAQADQDKKREAELRLELSKILIDRQQKIAEVEKALAITRELDEPKLIENLLSRRELLAPRFTRKPTKSQWLAMAHDLRYDRQFAAAEKYYNKVIQAKLPLPTRISALKGLAQNYKTQRKKDEYIQTLEKIVQLTRFSKKSKNKAAIKSHFDAVINLVRALWTEGQVSRARHLLNTNLKTFAKKYPRGEIYWLLGRMSEEARDWSEAIRWFQLAQDETAPKTELYEKVEWYLAWNLRKLNKFAEAAEALKKGRDQSINEFSKARFQYWLARSLHDLDSSSEETRQAYLDLIEMDPLGYYGLLAHRDLKKPIQPIEKTAAVPATASIFSEIVDITLFEWLISVEEFEIAREVLDEASESLRRRKLNQEDEATWTDLLKSYARTGSYIQLYERLGKIPAVQRQNILAHHPELLFPQPYRDTVQSAASQFEVPGELIFAIMRQESSFNPKARSPADAFGLMQLLPEVAAGVAPLAKVNYEVADDLYRPDVNIPLGAYHVRELWQRFNGQFILAVASYNASERSIRNWMKVRFDGDAVTFIEDIPYEETRGYIRLVMRNMIFYQLLNNNRSEMKFPDWVFDLKPLD